jgi:hypothetical protein
MIIDSFVAFPLRQQPSPAYPTDKFGHQNIKTFQIVFIRPQQFVLPSPAAPLKPPQYIFDFTKPFLVRLRFLFLAVSSSLRWLLFPVTKRPPRNFVYATEFSALVSTFG